MTMSEILAAIKNLPDDERAVLVRHLMFGIEPIEPVKLTITRDEEGVMRMTMPDGREVEELVELDLATRYNYPMGNLDDKMRLDIYQDVADFDTVVWFVELDGKMIPVTLPDDLQINYI